MKITEPGIYQMTESRGFRGSASIETWPKGMVFEVTQIDNNYNKVIGPHFPDWIHNSIPCEPVGEDSLIGMAYRWRGPVADVNGPAPDGTNPKPTPTQEPTP